MSGCLTDAVLVSLIGGTLPTSEQPEVDQHLRSCERCSARLTELRETTMGDLLSKHQAETQFDVTMDSHRGTPGGRDELSMDFHPDVEAKKPDEPLPNIPVETFLDSLSQSGLFPATELQKLREQTISPSMSSSSMLADWLVREGKLTNYQANLLSRGKTGSLVLGNYVILDMLGQGGMGTVYKALHRRMNRIVALKVLPSSLSRMPDALARFQREVQAAARLHHTNLAAAYDADEASGIHFLVMEYCDGPNLSSYVKEAGPMPLAAAVRLMAQAARGMWAAHQQGVVHRDIKPGNMIVTNEGRLKILDLGLAQLRGDTSEENASDMTQTGRVMGTVDFMSPEQARNAKSVDARADVYSLGCTLYFLATGETPAPNGSVAAKLLWHQTQTAPPLRTKVPAASEALETTLSMMMAKEPDERQASMLEVAQQLEACLADMPEGQQEISLVGLSLPAYDSPSTFGNTSIGRRTIVEGHNETIIGSDTVRTLQKEQGETDPPSTSGNWIAIGGVALSIAAVLFAAYFFLAGGSGAADAVLVLQVDQGAAEVVIDGKEKQLAPSTPSQPLELKLTPGEHRVVIRKNGFTPQERTVDLRRDQPTRLSIQLAAAGAPLATNTKPMVPPSSTTPTTPTIPGPPPTPPTPVFAHEAACSWVFALGGKVTAVTTTGREIVATSLEQLPAEPLEVLSIHFDDRGVTDTDLESLELAPGLRQLSLAGTPITDAGLLQVAKLKQLAQLSLARTKITNKGLESLARLSQLAELDLSQTKITDQGLPRLVPLPRLEKLYVADNTLSDTGIEQLSAVKSLRLLVASGTMLTERGHASLTTSLPQLELTWDGADMQRAVALALLEKGARLSVTDSRGSATTSVARREDLPPGRLKVLKVDLASNRTVTDDDLKQLIALSDLESLSIAGTKITPVGIDHLHGLSSLKTIDLGSLPLTSTSIETLAAALPDCKIERREPADRLVAKWVLSVGGKCSIAGESGAAAVDLVSATTVLPEGPIRVEKINLTDCKLTSDAPLAQLAELSSVKSLLLAGSDITDEQLASLTGLKTLVELSLADTQVSTPAVSTLLAQLPQLERLYLSGSKVDRAVVSSASNLPRLTHLSLAGISTTPADLTLLKKCPQLEWLDLSKTGLTDETLGSLQQFSKLRELTVLGNSISDAGYEELVASLPNCRVTGDPLDPQRLAARWVLEQRGSVQLETGALTSTKDLPRSKCHVLSIDLAEIPNLKSTELASTLAACPELESLRLSDTTVTDGELAAVAKLRLLKRLYLANLAISDEGLARLADLELLEELDVSGSRITAAGLANWKSSATLKQLTLANTLVSDPQLSVIATFNQLELLDLSACRGVSDAGLAKLAQLTNLRSLSLRGTKLTDEAADVLAKFTLLQQLDLDSTTITDTGVAKLLTLASLKRLVLAKTGITDSGVASLAKLKELKSVSLVRTSVSEAACAELEKALPGCMVIKPAQRPPAEGGGNATNPFTPSGLPGS